MTSNDETGPPAPNGSHTPRSGNGRFVRSLATAERDAKMADMRGRGMSYRQIAAELGVGVSTARDGVERCMAATVGESGEVARAVEAEKLDAMERRALVILENPHPLVQQGRIVREIIGQEYDEEADRWRPIYGDPLPDLSIELRAFEMLLKVADRRAKLMGHDAATKINVQGGDPYEVHTLKEKIREYRSRGITVPGEVA